MLNVKSAWQRIPVDGAPGRRWGSATWSTSDGRLWLYGGTSPEYPTDDGGRADTLADLWSFDPVAQIWSLDRTAGQSPGARSNAAFWHDRNDGLWLCGGGAAGRTTFSDLWYRGCDGAPWSEVQVTGETPGRRFAPASWTDGDGNGWLFGGIGEQGREGMKNDLWVFSRENRHWSQAAPGVTGADTSHWPLPRCFAAVDARSQDAWIFGGLAMGSRGETLGDLWHIDLHTRIATCLWPVDPTTTSLRPDQIVSSPDGPCSRSSGVLHADRQSRLWLIGGFSRGELNDVWCFDLAKRTWHRDRESGYADGVPSPRNAPASWRDVAGNRWLYGGIGIDEDGEQRALADVWRFAPDVC